MASVRRCAANVRTWLEHPAVGEDLSAGRRSRRRCRAGCRRSRRARARGRPAPPRRDERGTSPETGQLDLEVVGTDLHRGVPHVHLAHETGEQRAKRRVVVDAFDGDGDGRVEPVGRQPAGRSTISPTSQTWCSSSFASKSMDVTSSRAGSRRPPGGWKWTPFGAVELDPSGVRPPGGRRDAIGAAERARKCFVRRVAGLVGNLEDAALAGQEPIRRALEQDASPQPRRRLARGRRDHPVEVEPRQEDPRREVVTGRGVISRPSASSSTNRAKVST